MKRWHCPAPAAWGAIAPVERAEALAAGSGSVQNKPSRNVGTPGRHS